MDVAGLGPLYESFVKVHKAGGWVGMSEVCGLSKGRASFIHSLPQQVHVAPPGLGHL